MPSRPSVLRKPCGFTLIELMIVVAIAALLASIALPSFMQQVRKGRRSDAHEAAAAVMQAQERWRGNNPAYADKLDLLAVPATSKGGYYTLALSDPSASGYTLKLTAVSSKSQAGDTGCATLTVVVSGGQPGYAQPQCWSR